MLRAIKQIPGVEIAYPNMEFPARVTLLGDSTSLRFQAMPAEMKKYKPFNDMLAGSFYKTDSSGCVVIREEILSRFKIRLENDDKKIILTKEDSAKGVKILSPDSIIGKTISVVSLSMNTSKIPNALFSLLRNKPEVPFEETVTELTVCGILKKSGPFGSDLFKGGIIIPTGTAQKIPKLGFSSVYDLLDNKHKKGTYSSIHVRINDLKRMDEVKKALKDMKVGVFSIADQLEEIKRGFLLLDSMLGAIGAIALIVAGLGIINTMVMSILERTREIGIMKAIGGSETEIKMIFFVEAAVIGLIGGIFGLILGWIVTKVANLVMNAQILPAGEDPLSLFYFPAWLILGALAFSLFISLAAALYPAMRAARIDPVKALRHD